MNEIFFPTDDEIIEFCHEYKKIKPHKVWHCLMRMDVKPEILHAMHDAGCRVMNCGIESGSNRVLNNIIKEISVEQTKSFCKAARDAGIIIQGSWMFGNFGERREEVAQTVDLLKDVNVHGPVALTINYPGTRNYRHALKNGMIPDQLAYIESLDRLYGQPPLTVIAEHRAGRVKYLNLTDMDDDTLFTSTEWELRRYATTLFPIKDIVENSVQPSGKWGLKGRCPFCAFELQVMIDPQATTIQSLRRSCDGCGADWTYFPPSLVPVLGEHLATIAGALDAASTVVLAGTAHGLVQFLHLGLSNLDYGKVVGVMEGPGLRPGNFLANHQILSLDEIASAQPDLVLVVDGAPPGLAEGRPKTAALPGCVVSLFPRPWCSSHAPSNKAEPGNAEPELSAG